MNFRFPTIEPPPGVSSDDWLNWKWQVKASLRSEADFSAYFQLSSDEKRGFLGAEKVFNIRTTPYYAQLVRQLEGESSGAIRRILIPNSKEMIDGFQAQLDPLGERKNNPVSRVIHRYPDRALFLVTDFCSVYCRYCTRKHFTGQSQVFPAKNEYENALEYFRKTKSIKEVILSGGDPLTLGVTQLEKVLKDLRSIEHIEIIRIGSRVPVVNPMRINEELVGMMKKYHPIYIMNHFNHPKEITFESKQALALLANNGFPLMNQMVLLNGVNNHAAIVKHLSRKLLFLRVKPYYMFQCDPSIGTDHLRTPITQSLQIQKELFGNLSGLAMPTYSIDIPSGGGKAYMVPDYVENKKDNVWTFKGWDGVIEDYVDPSVETLLDPPDIEEYI